ncbi:copper homeostasis protein CutC [Phaeosphaeriaceae sp. PMI808]|nr:copper homeostasis protein CutC [Phaeosphaeriaceae sp. PMI808]
MLEVACFTVSSAISAARAGADRLELCADYSAGGITPSMHSLLQIRKETDIPINIMIRPRAGNFHYSAAGFEQMRHDIALFATLASGFVFGILDIHGHVDVARNSELVDIASPLPCTFHRAIDEAADLDEAVEMVIACGFKSLLTSGGKKNAEEGAERVKHLQEKFGKKVSLIVGGGVRSSNAAVLTRRVGVQWVHSAAITKAGEEVDVEEVIKMKDALHVMQNDGFKDVNMDD